MKITNINSFLDYYEKVRARTLRVIKCIPHDKLEWTYKEGKFTIGDLIRHIAAIERYMTAENVRGNKSTYAGCGRDLAEGYENVLEFLSRTHAESIEIFRSLTNEDLQKKCITPGGAPITVWKWLRSLIEHEIHHRGQIYLYLAMLEIETPPLYGLTSEEVLERSK